MSVEHFNEIEKKELNPDIKTNLTEVVYTEKKRETFNPIFASGVAFHSIL